MTKSLFKLFLMIYATPTVRIGN